MSDLISRQVAIDAVNKICDRCGEHKKYDGVMCGTCYLDGVADIIEDLPSVQPNLQPTCNNLATDTISRQALCEYALSQKDKSVTPNDIMRFPSAQPELTDDRAIKHLQSTGWMQNHDKEMYEMGLKEQLADDSGGYDGLIPCEDTISRQAAIDTLYHVDEYNGRSIEAIRNLPSAQPEIIHCKDCIRYGKDDCFMKIQMLWELKPDDFCSYAERREEQE